MIIVKNLTKHFGAKEIIRNFSYNFPTGAKIAIVGANGVGKTTLINILIGLEEYESGEVIIPNDCIVGYIPQVPCSNPKITILEECLSGNNKLYNLSNEIKDLLNKLDNNYSEDIYNKYLLKEEKFSHYDGYAFEAKAKSMLLGLEFAQEQFNQSPMELSGGWRMRLELAKMLMNDPNFILLDEPTNHLDLPSLIWLEGYLRTFNGTLLFISHDKEFINGLADKVMHIQNGFINVYNGNFNDFLEQKEAHETLMQKQKASISKKTNQLQAFVDRFRYKASKAKQAQSKLKIIEKLKQIENKINLTDNVKLPLFKMEIEYPSSKVVLEIKDGSIGYTINNPINNTINFKLMRGWKVAVIGTNGIGKSTLLKTIAKQIPLLSGQISFCNNLKIGYYAQNQLDVLNPKLNAIDNLLSLVPSITIQQARTVLGNLLITNEDINKPIAVMSGGEKSKIAIAAILASKNNFIMLDEPTNHLDMSSVDVLANALSEYPGTLLVVSHNRSFINVFADHILQMDRKKPAELVGVICN
ncbi:MAG: ABC-F family ATP-binding cassette domain-containing protein [Alphaproteobacteria bacterium]|nr:ABC-F family ATP-binding cassette domain-containing protein [Alphaproteobacteria bacterium]